MSDAPTPSPHAPSPPPGPAVFTSVPPSRGASCLGVAFGISLVFNLLTLVVLLIGIWFFFLHDDSASSLNERSVSGKPRATNKVAVIEVEGVLMEGLLGHAHRQIETAARDKHVKAIVLRINSPGGTITASDDLYYRLVR